MTGEQQEDDDDDEQIVRMRVAQINCTTNQPTITNNASVK